MEGVVKAEHSGASPSTQVRWRVTDHGRWKVENLGIWLIHALKNRAIAYEGALLVSVERDMRYRDSL